MLVRRGPNVGFDSSDNNEGLIGLHNVQCLQAPLYVG